MLIDLTKIPDRSYFSDAQRQGLVEWLSKHSHRFIEQDQFFDIPGLGQVKFKYSMIWFTKGIFNRSLEDTQTPEINHTFELFNQSEILGYGGQGMVHAGIGTLTVHSTHLSFSTVAPRVIKVGPKNHFSTVEKDLHKRSHSLNYQAITEIGDTGYLVMNKAGGANLTGLLKNNTWTFEERVTLSINLLRAAVDTTHMGVIHRDLKPDHIMIDDDLSVKFIDFGISKFLSNQDEDEVAQTETFHGTMQYAASETFNDQCTSKSDVYSIGLIIAQIFGATLKPGEKGREIVPQAMVYSEKMSCRGRLNIEADETVVKKIEHWVDKMIVASPESRLTGEAAIAACPLILRNAAEALSSEPLTPSFNKDKESCWFESHPSSAGGTSLNSPMLPAGARSGAFFSKPSTPLTPGPAQGNTVFPKQPK